MRDEEPMNRSMQLVRVVVASAVAAWSSLAGAQAPAPATPPATVPAPSAEAPAATSSALEELAWLRGCWEGSVNRRDVVEQWLPPRGGMMVGVTHTIVTTRENPQQPRTEDYTYLRLEQRNDGVYYVAVPSGTKELPFKLTRVDDDQGAKVFTFTRSGEGFPQSIVYRHTPLGSLFAEVSGNVDGKDRKVIYPMHPIDCLTGAAEQK